MTTCSRLCRFSRGNRNKGTPPPYYCIASSFPESPIMNLHAAHIHQSVSSVKVMSLPPCMPCSHPSRSRIQQTFQKQPTTKKINSPISRTTGTVVPPPLPYAQRHTLSPPQPCVQNARRMTEAENRIVQEWTNRIELLDYKQKRLKINPHMECPSIHPSTLAHAIISQDC